MTTTGKPPVRPTAASRTAARKRQRERRQMPIVAIVVVVVVVLGLVAFFATRGGSKSDVNTGASGGGVQQTRPVTVSGTALPKLPDSGADPAIGKEIPRVDGQSFDGAPVSISNDGRAKLIFIVAHWCPHCEKEVPVITDWLKNKKLPTRTDMLAVSSSVNPSAPDYPPSSWLSKAGWPVPTIADDAKDTAAAQFGVSGFPFMLAVDAQGKVVERVSGEQPVSELERLLAKATGTAG